MKCIVKNMLIISGAVFTFSIIFKLCVVMLERIIGDYVLIPLFAILIYLTYKFAKAYCEGPQI